MTTGIHHITAIAGDAQANVDFYTGLLGLRLVKRTINFDDPGTWHFYYGDDAGSPGTLLTFFPWGSEAARGRAGVGQAVSVSFSVPAGSLGFWSERLAAAGSREVGTAGEKVLALADPDGIALRLVEARGVAGGGHAIRGLHAVELRLRDPAPTAALMTQALGFRPAGGGGQRLESGAGGPGTFVDLVRDSEGQAGRMGAGAVHHVAWRIGDDAGQLALQRGLLKRGLPVTEVRDRQYFRSIYFREPGGVLFEVATDGPGFAIDEERLGSGLKLPPWLEEERAKIEPSLAPVRFPGGRHGS